MSYFSNKQKKTNIWNLKNLVAHKNKIGHDFNMRKIINSNLCIKDTQKHLWLEILENYQDFLYIS